MAISIGETKTYHDINHGFFSGRPYVWTFALEFAEGDV